jgi:hypothetical protein
LLGGCLSSLVGLCLFGVALVAAWYGFDAFLGAPWAYSLSGRPTLTGAWVGQFTVPSGLRFALVLNMRRARFLAYSDFATDEPAQALLEGEASWCDDHGRHAEALSLEGQVPMWSGQGGSAGNVQVTLDSANHPQSGLQPAYFNSGAWQADTLTLAPDYIFYDAQTHGLVTSTDNPDLHNPPAVVLKKSDPAAFAAACASLGRAS